MTTARLEAFSDGTLAIVITITVLNIRLPVDASLASLLPVIPVLLIYAWSFQTIGTYWNNHHHLVHAAESINSRIMWANLHLLFWLSLVPFTTAWLGLHIGTIWPSACYAAVLLLAAFAYRRLQNAIVAHEGRSGKLHTALGEDRKGRLSLILYVLAIIAAFFYPYLSYVLVVLVALMWFVPDRRLRFL